ncbi:hypothetical protein ACFW9D_28835, partial [Streptomyces sp. NPDC059524]
MTDASTPSTRAVQVQQEQPGQPGPQGQQGHMNEIDIHTTAGKLDDLRRRIDEATHAGSARAVEKQHAKG